MARPIIEFIQSQQLPWQNGEPVTGRPDTRVKVLSLDSDTGARTLLVQYPPAYHLIDRQSLSADEELFILKGALTINGQYYPQHGYGYFPANFVRSGFSSEDGAIVLTFLEGAPVVQRPAPTAPTVRSGLIEALDTSAMPWDLSNIDPHVNHLQTARKNLRLAPDGRCRTYLLSGRPQGRPPSGVGHRERHPHVEEFFFIAGDLSCHVGVMRAGAYCWRPPGVWHGLDCSRNGFFAIFRSPGANVNVNDWEPEERPIPWEAVYKPTLPPDLAEHVRNAIPDQVNY